MLEPEHSAPTGSVAAIAFAAMKSTRLTLRLATVADGPTLQTIERAAGEQFRTIGMAHIADDERTVVGYCLADVVDDNAHLEQISVLPQWQGHGVARQLLGVLRAWSTSPITRVCKRLTL